MLIFWHINFSVNNFDTLNKFDTKNKIKSIESHAKLFILNRYAGVPVDFEEITIDPSVHSDADLEYAITSIKRNGVAIKGIIVTKM